MANKYEIKHTKDVLDFDVPAEPDIDHYARLNEKRAVDFRRHDESVDKGILFTYKEESEFFDKASIDERIMQLSRLHRMREFSGWLIGDLLVRIRNTTGDIHSFLTENEDALGFKKSAGYNYISIRENVSLQDYEKLGVKKTLVVAAIKDVETRQEVVKEIVKKKMDEVQAREYVDNLVSEQKQEQKKEQEREIRKILKAHPVDVIVNDKKLKPNEILIRLADQEEKNLFNEALNKYMAQIKAYMEKF